MIKNLTANQVLLIGLATVLLLLTAASFYLLQDPNASLPFSAQPTLSGISPTSLSSTSTPAPSSTSLPTRQTSYTPLAALGTLTFPPTVEITGTEATAVSTITGSFTPPPSASPQTATPGSPQPTTIPTNTLTPTQAGPTVIPTVTQTLIAGEHVVTGRIIQNSTPIANVKVSFSDDDPPRQATTNSGGHYSFTTLAPGTNFVLQYSRADNPQVTPVAEVASLFWIQGNLPTGVDVITLPDMELSLNFGGQVFELGTPVDGAAYSAAAITQNNPIQFTWSLYNQGEYYFVELGAIGNDEPIWISDDTTATSTMWDGTLDSGAHISEGNYWWRVGTSKTSGDYYLFIYTPQADIEFNP